MKTFAFCMALTLIVGMVTKASGQGSAASEAGNSNRETPAALNFKMKSIDGKEVNLADYKGNVVLMVNTASKCGLTPQYKELQSLHDQYSAKGLKILGFPCNQFLRQSQAVRPTLSNSVKRTTA